MATKKATSATKKTETVNTVTEAVKETPAEVKPVTDKIKTEKAAAKKETTVKEPVKKSTKTTVAKKETTKKTTAAKKETAKKEIKVNTIVEHYGRQVEEKVIIANVKKAWTKSGKKVGDIKTIELYIKPEENAAYYVVNGSDTGAVALYE